MGKVKLTKAQERYLSDLAKSPMSAVAPPVKAMLRKLARIGLAEIVPSHRKVTVYALTPAGRAALKGD